MAACLFSTTAASSWNVSSKNAASSMLLSSPMLPSWLLLVQYLLKMFLLGELLAVEVILLVVLLVLHVLVVLVAVEVLDESSEPRGTSLGSCCPSSPPTAAPTLDARLLISTRWEATVGTTVLVVVVVVVFVILDLRIVGFSLPLEPELSAACEDEDAFSAACAVASSCR